jgi:hypothetical protein
LTCSGDDADFISKPAAHQSTTVPSESLALVVCSTSGL